MFVVPGDAEVEDEHDDPNIDVMENNLEYNFSFIENEEQSLDGRYS